MICQLAYSIFCHFCNNGTIQKPVCADQPFHTGFFPYEPYSTPVKPRKTSRISGRSATNKHLFSVYWSIHGKQVF